MIYCDWRDRGSCSSGETNQITSDVFGYEGRSEESLVKYTQVCMIALAQRLSK